MFLVHDCCGPPTHVSFCILTITPGIILNYAPKYNTPIRLITAELRSVWIRLTGLGMDDSNHQSSQ